VTTTRSSTILALLAISVLTLGTGGCGGGDPESNLTKTQFIKQGEKICQDAESEQIERFAKYRKAHPDGEELDLVSPVLLPALEKEVRMLRALGAPSGDEETVEALLRGLEGAIEKARKDPETLLVGESDPFDEPNALAKEYGFKTCAKNP
jgi:hypothetical protein